MNKIFYLILLLFIQFIYSCNKENVGSSEKPTPVTEYEITPINGGAVITYTVPNDPNVLCVTAEYLRNGQKFIERSSYHKNSLRIEGFKNIEPVVVTLYTENSNEERSERVIIEFTPLKSLVDLAKESMEILTTFGGINLSWNNSSNTELNIHILAYIDGKLTREEIYFSGLSKDSRAYRGFESVETKFTIVIGDKWQNISDTIFYVTTPIFEMEVPKPWDDMRAYVYGDNLTEYGDLSHTYDKFFDGLIGEGAPGYLNKAGSEGNSFTFDLNEVFKLNRFKFWPTLFYYGAEFVYGNVNITEFSMWGSPVLDTTKPDSYWVNSEDPTGTFKEDWVYLGYFARERVDLQGATDAEIWQRGLDGDEFMLPEDLAPVRYIRFFAEATAGGKPSPNNYWQLGELSFFGTNQFE